jgi:antitoxin VapB
MDMVKLFVNGRSQAVRLPKAYRFDDDEVCIAKLDDVVILYPRRKGWELLAKGIARFTHDFMDQRHQPAAPDERADL